MWNAFVPNEAKVWSNFYLYWLEQSKQLPIMMVRYEDILQDEKMWVQRMMDFLESGKAPEGYRWKSHWNAYSSHAVGTTIDGAGYKPKKVTHPHRRLVTPCYSLRMLTICQTDCDWQGFDQRAYERTSGNRS